MSILKEFNDLHLAVTLYIATHPNDEEARRQHYYLAVNFLEALCFQLGENHVLGNVPKNSLENYKAWFEHMKARK